MAVMQWVDAFVLDNARMDQTHHEYVDMLNALDEVADDVFAAGLNEFIAHTEAHFGQEDRWMKRTNFAPVNCHTSEHANVLEIMREVRRRVGEGDFEIGRRLIKELGPWFANHAETMDAALAYHVGAVGFDTTTEAFVGSLSEEARALLDTAPMTSCGTACGDAHEHGASGTPAA